MDVRYEERGGIWICLRREGCVVFKGEGEDKVAAYMDMIRDRIERLNRMEAEY